MESSRIFLFWRGIAGNRRPGFVSVSESSMTAPVVLLIDDSLDEEHLHQLQESLHTFLDSLYPGTRIGIVTYGRTVAVYDLSESEVAAADVLPGDSTISQELKQTLIYGTGVYLAPVHACLAIAHSIVGSLRPYRGGFVESKRERCLGTAVEVVLALIQGPATDLPVGTSKRSGGRSRVLLCVGGPTTLGPGALPFSSTHPNYAYLEKKAIKHMEHLGQEARRLDIAVDIFCAGTCPVRIPTLQPLVNASGGLLVLHDDFGEMFATNLQRAVRRSTGFRGVLEIRCSDDVAITRVIGKFFLWSWYYYTILSFMDKFSHHGDCFLQDLERSFVETEALNILEMIHLQLCGYLVLRIVKHLQSSWNWKMI